MTMKELSTNMGKSTQQNFNFGYVPPKEGRVPPASVRMHRRRRATVIFIVIGVAIICLVMKYVSTINIPSSSNSFAKDLKKNPTGLNAKESKQEPLKASEPVTTSSVVEVKTTESPVAAPTKLAVPQKEVKKEKKIGSGVKSEADFDKTLQEMIYAIPSEMQQRALLAPIKTSGAERIHELGLRTREYKRLFEAWEKLHMIFEDDGVVIKDDVIAYLRSKEKSFKKTNALRAKSVADDEDFDLAATIRDYENFRWLLQSMGEVLFPWTRPYYGDHMSLHAQLYSGGRGIVFTAGTDQAPFVLTSIGVLRALGCNLPIEVMYLGDGDLDVDARERLEEIPGVITRDIRLMVKDEGWALAGWAGKPFAILLSSFREVIFIDADAIFLQNPEVLFDDPSYQETGALFFFDRLMKADGKRNWMESVLPKPVSKKARKSRMWGESDHQQESGVVVVDTFKHFIPMLVVSRMNGPDRDGNADKGIVGVYDMLFGDKETFWLSWELVGSQSYSFHSGPAGIIGNLPSELRNTSHTPHTIKTGSIERQVNVYETNVSICAPQLLHISRDGNPLWFNGWILANKFDKIRSPIAQLELFMKEPDTYLEPESWTIGESNSCCLRNEETFEFTEIEKENIETILRVAFKVGAVGRRGGGPRRTGASLYG